MKKFASKYSEISGKKRATIYIETSLINNLLSKLVTLDYSKLDNVPKERGIYLWFRGLNIEYIGVANNKNGLYGRVVRQHLNEEYLEFRPTNQSSKDTYQLAHAIEKVDGKEIKYGIDKSTFRKKIGRKFELRPSKATVDYIKKNGSFKYVPVENISKEILELIETILIGFFKPELNDSKKNINVREVDTMPTKTEICNLKV
tara:strand:+ start:23 stop:628 length:606 start_codon:yes stop_codon:yes gene_type:complete